MLIGYSEFLDRYVRPFDINRYIHDPKLGFIVWRLGTGENVELLHIRAASPRQGQGRQLVYQMLDTLRDSPPFHSIFGFTRVSNTRAIEFYKALGFCCETVTGLYAEGQAALFWQEYPKLLAAKDSYEKDATRIELL